jgi:hypothetical protein
VSFSCYIANPFERTATVPGVIMVAVRNKVSNSFVIVEVVVHYEIPGAAERVAA